MTQDKPATLPFYIVNSGDCYELQETHESTLDTKEVSSLLQDTNAPNTPSEWSWTAQIPWKWNDFTTSTMTYMRRVKTAVMEMKVYHWLILWGILLFIPMMTFLGFYIKESTSPYGTLLSWITYLMGIFVMAGLWLYIAQTTNQAGPTLEELEEGRAGYSINGGDTSQAPANSGSLACE